MAIAEFHYWCNKIAKIPQFNENETPLPDYHRDHGVDHPGIQLMITHYLPNQNDKAETTKKPPQTHQVFITGHLPRTARRPHSFIIPDYVQDLTIAFTLSVPFYLML